MSDFSDIRAGLERRFEDIIVDIMGTTNADGFKLLVDETPIIAEFNKLLDSAEGCYLSDERVCIRGDSQNED